MPIEEWKQLAEYRDYAVSNCGYVMRLTDGLRYKAMQIVIPVMTAVGYLAINVYPQRKLVYIHRLVAETFLGDCPGGYECHHIDGDKTNNKVENLEWVSKKEHLEENLLESSHKGSGNPMSKLTEDDVDSIKQLLQEGFPGRTIAKLYGISSATVSMLKHNKRWNT
jgi:hypothetical protein